MDGASVEWRWRADAELWARLWFRKVLLNYNICRNNASSDPGIKATVCCNMRFDSIVGKIVPWARRNCKAEKMCSL
jgi:hypothetical protein